MPIRGEVVWAALLLSGCGAAPLEIPDDHPASPAAPIGPPPAYASPFSTDESPAHDLAPAPQFPAPGGAPARADAATPDDSRAGHHE